MQRYFTQNRTNNIFTLSDSDSYHIKKVMRMNIDDKVEIVCNNTLFISKIIDLSNNVRCEIIEEIKKENMKKPYVILVQSLVKEQKMDYILQKSCELGVDEIIPIKSERSIVNIDSKVEKKLDRWQKILKEASEQSKRLDVPKINNIMNISDLSNVNANVKLICTVNEKSKTIKSVLSNLNNSDTIIFVIGPEGGFSRNEEDLLFQFGFIPISFGNNVLRTETASLFVLSAINYELLR